MSKTSVLKIFGVFSIGIISLLVFFQDEIMVHLIDPIQDIIRYIFNLIPVILFSASGIFLISGLISKRNRVSCLIFSALCFLFGFWLSNPSGLVDIVNMFAGRPETPKGWH